MPTRAQNDRLRANLYGLLAALLAGPPADATLRLLAGIQAEADLEGPLAACWQELRAEAACRTPGQLDEEFHLLFIGLGRGEVVPYGSWYLTGHLMDKPLALLRGDLANLGIERRPESRETEDHAAALCETMALIIGLGTPESRKDQQYFYCRHIAPWMSRFFVDLQTAPSARFYGAVGRLGEAFLFTERLFFSLAPGAGPLPRQAACRGRNLDR
jgi:TorA maturation chaperone TorD